MWTATINFKKAFDSITDKSIWKALKSCGIEHDYISLLKKIHRDQKASVLTDEESNMFKIKKGTKQGDPLSSLLFNRVLQTALEDDIPRWQKKKRMRIYLSRTASKNVVRSTEKYRKSGTQDHPGKTKILSNQSSNIGKEIEIDDIKVELLTREESTKYLGQMITFQQQETTEIRNRVRAAWATFHKYRQELTSRNYPLKHRRWLCDAVVTPTMCYASGTWTSTKENERMIQLTQRKTVPTHRTNERKIQKDRETK